MRTKKSLQNVNESATKSSKNLSLRRISAKAKRIGKMNESYLHQNSNIETVYRPVFDNVEDAFKWVEKTFMSGNISEAKAMLDELEANGESVIEAVESSKIALENNPDVETLENVLDDVDTFVYEFFTAMRATIMANIVARGVDTQKGTIINMEPFKEIFG